MGSTLVAISLVLPILLLVLGIPANLVTAKQELLKSLMGTDREAADLCVFLGTGEGVMQLLHSRLGAAETAGRFRNALNAADLRDILNRESIRLILFDPAHTAAVGRGFLDDPEFSRHRVPSVFLTPEPQRDLESALLSRGAAAVLSMTEIWRLPFVIDSVLANEARIRRQHGQGILVDTVRNLSLARSMGEIVEIVRHATRRLSNADGATFVLRENDKCHYVDEDAIEPLWKGLRFPLTACISGWVMLNRRAATIEDIYEDPRIPLDAYRPTFVKSLVMVPIRTSAPIGAIGTYWAKRRATSDSELELIQLLADSAALAIETVQTRGELENRVRERTASLEAVNKELEAFSYTVCHDLRSPLSVIALHSEMLKEQGPGQSIPLDEGLAGIQEATERMRGLIEDMLNLSRVTQSEIVRRRVDLSAMASGIVRGYASRREPSRIRFTIDEGMRVSADPNLLRIALENLVSNAVKYSAMDPSPLIRIGRAAAQAGSPASFFIEDNGIGFPIGESGNLFKPFRRLSTSAGYPGTGVGLATVARIMEKHGGAIWAESSPGKGTRFHFTIPEFDASAPYIPTLIDTVDLGTNAVSP